MNTENLKAITALAEKLATAKEFNLLEPHPRREKWHTAKLNFRGFNDLTLTAIDIIKVCTSALYGMEDNDDDRKYASAFTIAEVLGLALELMPIEESQILDQCYELHLKLKANNEDNNQG